MKIRVLTPSILLAVAVAFAPGPAAPSPGWPQWGGPTRDFKDLG
jgi:hypothetical protein